MRMMQAELSTRFHSLSWFLETCDLGQENMPWVAVTHLAWEPG